jgi:hypothetical protein
MGSDVSASLGYGLEILSKIVEEANDLEDLITDDTLDFGFAGDSYDDDNKTFLFIKKSMVDVATYEDGGAKRIIPEKMVVRDGWNEKLKDWAKKHNIAKPKIGWYLLVSVS